MAPKPKQTVVEKDGKLVVNNGPSGFALHGGVVRDVRADDKSLQAAHIVEAVGQSISRLWTFSNQGAREGPVLDKVFVKDNVIEFKGEASQARWRWS